MNTDFAKTLLKDGEIESESAKLNYLDLVTENLRSNKKKITRNSFWMVLSVLLHVLVINEETSLKKISILFVSIENSVLLLNLIPVFFAFIFFQNIALWNNNINLFHIFEKLSSEVYNLGLTSDTKNVIKPFSLTDHVINYQFNNKRILNLFKFPTVIVLIVIMLFPILFVMYSVYIIAILNTPTFIPITCAILTSIIGFSAIFQALSTYKD